MNNIDFVSNDEIPARCAPVTTFHWLYSHLLSLTDIKVSYKPEEPLKMAQEMIARQEEGIDQALKFMRDNFMVTEEELKEK